MKSRKIIERNEIKLFWREGFEYVYKCQGEKVWYLILQEPSETWYKIDNANNMKNLLIQDGFTLITLEKFNNLNESKNY